MSVREFVRPSAFVPSQLLINAFSGQMFDIKVPRTYHLIKFRRLSFGSCSRFLIDLHTERRTEKQTDWQTAGQTNAHFDRDERMYWLRGDNGIHWFPLMRTLAQLVFITLLKLICISSIFANQHNIWQITWLLLFHTKKRSLIYQTVRNTGLTEPYQQNYFTTWAQLWNWVCR